MAEDTVYLGLRTMLASSTAFVALVPMDRVRPFGKLKQNETLPAVTLFRLSARRWPGYGRESGHADVQVQLDVYGTTERQTLDVAEQVRLALQNQSQGSIRGTFLNTERDWYEDQSESFRILQQWNIHHAE